MHAVPFMQWQTEQEPLPPMSRQQVLLQCSPHMTTARENEETGVTCPSNAICAWGPLLDIVSSEVISCHQPTGAGQAGGEHISHNTVLQEATLLQGGMFRLSYLDVQLVKETKKGTPP